MYKKHKNKVTKNKERKNKERNCFYFLLLNFLCSGSFNCHFDSLPFNIDPVAINAVRKYPANNRK